MPFWLAQERTRGDLKRTAAYRKTKSGADEDVRVGSPLQKDHLVYSLQSEPHWKIQQDILGEDIRHLLSPCCPCWTLKVSLGERDPVRVMRDARDCQI